LSGIMALADAAVLSITPSEIETMVQKNLLGARFLKKLYQHITRAVVVIVLFTNTINVLGPILVGQKAVEVFSSTVLGVITGILTFGTIIFSEIIPKSIAVRYSPTVSRIAAPVIQFSIYLLFPVVYILELVSNLFQSGKREIGTEAQIRALLSLGRKAGHIEADEHQLIEKVFTLNDKKASDIMIPWKDVISIDESSSLAAELGKFNTVSRCPVLGSDGKVKGMIMLRDVFNNQSGKLSDILQPVLFIGPELRSDDLLSKFLKKNTHLAIVQEGSTLLGIVSLEDVIEEIVGEIEDEKGDIKKRK
jgi:putative hemolysin